MRESDGPWKGRQAVVRRLFSPPLAGGDKGEGEKAGQELSAVFFTPTLALPHRGGGVFGDVERAHWGYMKWRRNS
jgi:hypothetical protein